MNRLITALIAALIVASVLFPSLAQVPQTTEQLQGWLMNPWVLFGLMLFGSVISAMKQWSQAKLDGAAAGVALSSHLARLQELFITLGGNAIAFFALVDSGNLNFVAAVSIGYLINDAADLNPLSTRSTALTQK
jgi:hypothetical protein